MNALCDDLLARGATDMEECFDGPLALADFCRRFCSPLRPVVFRGLACEWPCGQWSLDMFSAKYGNETSHVTADGENFEIMSVNTFCQLIKGGSSLMYMKDATWHNTTPLVEDFTTPAMFRNLLCSPSLTNVHPRLDSPNYPAWSWMYMGPRGSSSPIHVDIFESSAWNLVVQGRKLWVFFPPCKEELLQDEHGEFVDPFHRDNFDQIVPLHPVVVLQNEGDVVFTPSGWWHAVLNLEPGIALTENFVNESNLAHVTKCLHRELNECDSVNDPLMSEALAAVCAELVIIDEGLRRKSPHKTQ